MFSAPIHNILLKCGAHIKGREWVIVQKIHIQQQQRQQSKTKKKRKNSRLKTRQQKNKRKQNKHIKNIKGKASTINI